jgi:hypothetical protein
MNIIDSFYTTCIVVTPGAIETKQDVYIAFLDWCRNTDNTRLIPYKEQFNRFFSTVTTSKTKSKNVWHDIQLVNSKMTVQVKET